VGDLGGACRWWAVELRAGACTVPSAPARGEREPAVRFAVLVVTTFGAIGVLLAS
jgi:hypothetical protein